MALYTVVLHMPGVMTAATDDAPLKDPSSLHAAVVVRFIGWKLAFGDQAL
jgi:hypothetical protein